MGSYTELQMSLVLSNDTPKMTRAIIDYMLDPLANKMTKKLQAWLRLAERHPFFKTPRWRYIMIGSSYYFDGQPCSVFRFDKINDGYYLTFIANIKNYDNEHTLFMTWIQQYIKVEYPFMESKFIGYQRYEGDKYPTLLFFNPTTRMIELEEVNS